MARAATWTAGLALLLTCGAWTGVARADTTCVYDPVAHTVTATTDVADPSLATEDLGGGVIGFAFGPSADVPCTGATTTNTDTIDVTGPGHVALDARGGAFAPGFTPETSRASEIEIQVTGENQIEYLAPSGAPLVLTAGRKGIAVNDDADVDITTTASLFSVELVAGDGDDVVSARGGYGTGGILPAAIRFVGLGGPGGDDLVLGHAGFDDLELFQSTSGTARGYGGDDALLGGAQGAYRLDGGAGDDLIRALGGTTVLLGGAGADQLSLDNDTAGGAAFGGRGADVFRAANGAADALDGGPGNDQATVDAGDELTSIETVS